jgi:site-specific DNA recombinase
VILLNSSNELQAMMLKVGYARVSTVEQFYSQSLERQIEDLKRHGVDQVFSDIESGASSDKENFEKIVELIKQGKVDTLVAVAWDRLCRDKLLGWLLKAQLREYGVKLFLLNQGFVDLDTSIGELSSDIQILLSDYERKMIQERVRRAHANRRSKNIAWQVFPFGYKNVDGAYVLDTDPCVCPLEDRPLDSADLENEPDDSPRLVSWSKAQIAREMIEGFLELRKAARVIKRVHTRFGPSVMKERKPIPGLVIAGSVSGLKRWLRNPVLRGHTCYQKYPRKGAYPDISEWKTIPDTHSDQTLMSEEEYQEIEEIISSSHGKIGQPDRAFYLTGKIVCQECGGKCNLKSNKEHRYYGCGHARTYCSARKLTKIEDIEEAIIYQIAKRANEIHFEHQDAVSELPESSRITEIKQKIADIEKLGWATHDRDLTKIKRELQRELETEMNRPQEVAQQIIRHPQARKINFWYTLTKNEREIFYGKLVESVVISNGKVRTVNLRV